MPRRPVLCTVFACFVLLCLATHRSGAQDEAALSAAGRVNLAIVADPSASYVSGDTTLASLNDGNEPRRSSDRRRGAYGNWNRTGTQWVEYTWSQPISTDRVAVYWWMDGQGIHAPSECRLLYEKDDELVPVENPAGLELTSDQFNETTFDEITTRRLRLEIDSDGSNSTGILEWQVFDSGKSPKFPPRVSAGIDRVVVLGGKTYLDGEISTLNGDDSGTAVKWSKLSGPGSVQFDDATSLTTTASFHHQGEYVLRLTAADGDLEGSSTVAVQVTAAPPAL